MAHERIEKMKKETGRISNVDLQRKVINPFSFISAHFFSANMCLALNRSLVCDIFEVDRDLIRLATSRHHEFPSEGSGRRTFLKV